MRKVLGFRFADCDLLSQIAMLGMKRDYFGSEVAPMLECGQKCSSLACLNVHGQTSEMALSSEPGAVNASSRPYGHVLANSSLVRGFSPGFSASRSTIRRRALRTCNCHRPRLRRRCDTLA